MHAACLLCPFHTGSRCHQWKTGHAFAQADFRTLEKSAAEELFEREGHNVGDAAYWGHVETYGGLRRKLLHGCHRARCACGAPRAANGCLVHIRTD